MFSQPVISFGYSHKLKTLFNKGLLPTVKYDFYHNPIKPGEGTLEHVLPHSQGGGTTWKNLAICTPQSNQKRGNEPLCWHLTKEAFDTYCKEFEGIQVKNLNGKSYIKQLTETVISILKKEKEQGLTGKGLDILG